MFKTMKKAKNDFVKIKGKCPSTKSVTVARESKKKAAESIVTINKKIEEAKNLKAKSGNKVESSNLTLTIRNLRKERKSQTKVIRTNSRTIYRWKSGGIKYGTRWTSGKWRSGGSWKYGKGGSYKARSGCRSCQKVYDKYIKKCMGTTKAKGSDSKWQTCDAKYHQKLFGSAKLTQVEVQGSTNEKPEATPVSQSAF